MTSIDTQHTDLIHDTQMDYFGKRVATCSSDRTIRIFNVVEDSMTLATELKGHEGPVWQVSWAHPNFGSVLASCSFDRKVIIWKEEGGNWTIWHEFPFNRSVNTVAWAPVDLGLVIACGSSDGTISILSFSESAGWSKIKTLKAHEPGVNAVSWAPYQIGGPCRLVSGGSDNTVKIWTRKTEDGIEWDVETLSGHGHWVRDVAWAPNIGLPYSTIASSSQEGKVKIWTKLNNERVWTSVDLPLEGNEPVWRVSWSITGNILAVSSGDNRVSLWKESLEEKNDNKPVWRSISRLDENGDLIVADDEN